MVWFFICLVGFMQRLGAMEDPGYTSGKIPELSTHKASLPFSRIYIPSDRVLMPPPQRVNKRKRARVHDGPLLSSEVKTTSPQGVRHVTSHGFRALQPLMEALDAQEAEEILVSGLQGQLLKGERTSSRDIQERILSYVGAQHLWCLGATDLASYNYFMGLSWHDQARKTLQAAVGQPMQWVGNPLVVLDDWHHLSPLSQEFVQAVLRDSAGKLALCFTQFLQPLPQQEEDLEDNDLVAILRERLNLGRPMLREELFQQFAGHLNQFREGAYEIYCRNLHNLYCHWMDALLFLNRCQLPPFMQDHPAQFRHLLRQLKRHFRALPLKYYVWDTVQLKKWSQLTFLELEQVRVKGPFILRDLPLLEQMKLTNNQFLGPIYFIKLPALRLVEAYNNFFAGFYIAEASIKPEWFADNQFPGQTKQKRQKCRRLMTGPPAEKKSLQEEAKISSQAEKNSVL